MQRPSRRGVLQGIAVGAAVVAAGAPEAAEAAAEAGLIAEDAPSPWWLLAPLTAGSAVAYGWSIGSLSGVRQGAAVLRLTHASQGEIDVHLCAIDGAPKGVAHAEHVDLVAMDGGRGDKPTEEGLGLALRELARVIARNEASDGADLRTLSRLLPHHERVGAYGPEQL